MLDPIVVIGAGGVGLTAAVALASKGLPVQVIEAEAEDRVRPGSRAIFLMPHSLNVLNKTVPRLGDEIAAAGLQIAGAECYYAGKRTFRMRSPHLPGIWAGACLPQRFTEQILMAHAIDLGVQFTWGSPVVDMETTPDGARLVLADSTEVNTPYAIAADGARSTVRTKLNIDMDGERDDTSFIIVDVDSHPDGSTPRSFGHFHYAAPELGGRNVMHMPFESGMRIDLQCLPGDDVEYRSSPEGIAEWIGQAVDPWYGDHVQWSSQYRFRQAVATSYTDENHRILLAGEAAHLFAPWGGRGLNSGIYDASASASAISKALTGGPATARSFISSCATKRRKMGIVNRDASSRGLRQMTGSTASMRTGRAVAARVSPLVWPAGAWLMSGPTQPSLLPPVLKPSMM